MFPSLLQLVLLFFKLKVKMKRQHTGSNLHSLTSFDDARVLLDENIDMVIFFGVQKLSFFKEKKTSSNL